MRFLTIAMTPNKVNSMLYDGFEGLMDPIEFEGYRINASLPDNAMITINDD